MCQVDLCPFLRFHSKRQKIHVPILRVWSTDDPHPQEEVIVDRYMQDL